MLMPCGLERRHVAHRRAVDALHHHARSARQVPVHLGHVEQLAAAKVAPQLEALAASRSRSSSSKMVFLVLRTTSTRPQPAPVLPVALARPATMYSRPMSRRMVFSIPGRSTLTTTSRPSLSAGGVHLGDGGRGQGRLVEVVQNALQGCPRPSRSARAPRRRETAAPGPAARASSSARSSGSRSRRVERICPNLTKIGPRSSRARRMRTG